MIIHYVAGLLFDDDGTRVALIHKNHGPSAVVGKWSAIGGKIDKPYESSISAMRREFREEAGVDITGSMPLGRLPHWTNFLCLTGPGWAVDFYHAFSTTLLEQVRTCEKEVVDTFRVEPLLSGDAGLVPNLRWILPMALGHLNDNVYVYQVNESLVI